MKKLVYLLPMIALALPACGDDVSGATDGDESSGGGNTTGGPTSETMTDPTVTPTSSSTGGETDPDPTLGDSGSESSGDPPSCTPDDECTPDTVMEDCGEFFVCVGCLCVEDGDPPLCPDGWGDGEYLDCAADGIDVCTSETGLTPGCGVDDSDQGACYFSGCETACDCPAAPDPDFDDLVTCEDIIGDTANDCYLDCSGGADCPDGMYCFLDFICINGEGAPPAAGYGDCVNMEGCANANEGCIVDVPADPSLGFCTSGCMDADNCNPAPETGDAPVTCDDLTGDMMGNCFLDCSGGETCPDGMSCAFDSFCAWPVSDEGYGDCLNDGNAACVDGEACVVDTMSNPNTGVCASSDCVDAGECPSAPDGGDAAPICANIDGAAGDECALDCSGGETCPTGMACTGDGYCAWEETVGVGFDDCANNPDDVCLAGESCVTDTDADPDTSVCAQSGCVDPVADCPLAPAGGDAAVACSDIDGNAGDECVLDCSGGETCPTGMGCSADGYCAWDAAGFVLFEDFSSGAFAAGWNVFDVDGLTPAGAVDYVTDAWTVTDTIVAGDPAAYSTSWYAPAGAANDWMVSPPVPLTATSVLSWDGRAQDPMFPDGYEVYVVDSTDLDLLDFLMTGDPTALLGSSAPAFSIADELDVFTTRTLSAAAGQPLNPLVGQTVQVLWRNNSDDEFILMIDNISVTQ